MPAAAGGMDGGLSEPIRDAFSGCRTLMQQVRCWPCPLQAPFSRPDAACEGALAISPPLPLLSPPLSSPLPESLFPPLPSPPSRRLPFLQALATFSGLAAAERDGAAARSAAAAARQRGLTSRLAIGALRSEAEAGRAQYEAQLPLLAVGSAELRGYAGALKEGLRDSAPLLRRDVGRLLQQVGVKGRCGPGCVNMCVLYCCLGMVKDMRGSCCVEKMCG